MCEIPDVLNVPAFISIQMLFSTCEISVNATKVDFLVLLTNLFLLFVRNTQYRCDSQALTPCGRASHCQVTAVHNLASGSSLHNPDQMVPSAPDHKNASLLPPHCWPEPNPHSTHGGQANTVSASVSQDGRSPSGVLVCAMFCFCHLFNNPIPAMQLLSAKRPGSGLWPSHRRCVCMKRRAKDTCWTACGCSLALFTFRGAFERLLCSFCTVVYLSSN